MDLRQPRLKTVIGLLVGLIIPYIERSPAFAQIGTDEGFLDVINDSSFSGHLSQLPDPNRERFLQPSSDPPEPLPEDTELLPRPSTDLISPEETTQPSIPILVETIDVEGSTIFERDDFEEIVQPLEGKTVTLEQLNEAANQITQLYFSQGYITSRAILPPQEVVDGRIQIQVLEGSVEDIEIEGAERLGRYALQRIRLGTSTPLQVGAIEDRLLLLQSDPRFESISGSLQRGETLGQSKLFISLEEAFPFQSNLTFDNFSIPSVGEYRTGVGITHLNVFGLGDTFSTDYFRSTADNSQVIDISYTIPVNARDGTIQFRTLIQRDRPDTNFIDFSTDKSDSNRYEISYRQPIFRSIREELGLSVGFSLRNGTTIFSTSQGSSRTPNRNTSVFRFGQDYLSRDRQGVWSFRSQFNLGTGLFEASTKSTPADGEFFSWLGQLQRVQQIGDRHLLIIQNDYQLTPDPLLSSEQFSIGGGQSIRGYRQNAVSGDNGIRFSIEDRITLARSSGRPAFQLIPFFDLGYVWNNPENFDVDEPLIYSVGVGMLWQPIEGIGLRFDYGLPIVDVDFIDDSVQDDGFHFSFFIQPESFR